jgi:hypothetical protein
VNIFDLTELPLAPDMSVTGHVPPPSLPSESGRGMRASIASTYRFLRHRLGDKNVVADVALGLEKVGRFERLRLIFIKEPQELLVIEAVVVVVVDTSEVRDDADASESNEDLLMDSYSSPSYKMIVAVVAHSV